MITAGLTERRGKSFGSDSADFALEAITPILSTSQNRDYNRQQDQDKGTCERTALKHRQERGPERRGLDRPRFWDCGIFRFNDRVETFRGQFAELREEIL